jgi:hypothetical protein
MHVFLVKDICRLHDGAVTVIKALLAANIHICYLPAGRIR